MPVTQYFTVDDEIMGESASGTIRNYVRDALGSVVAMTDVSGVELYSARYRPYGSTLTSSGSAPSMTWNGGWGYSASSGAQFQEFTVDARFYSSRSRQWTILDPLWPQETSYDYTSASPVTLIDPSGLTPEFSGQQHLIRSKERKFFGKGLLECRKKSKTKAQCTECAERWYEGNMAYMPRKACEMAHAFCGDPKPCGPLGSNPDIQDGRCWDIMSVARDLNKYSDKLAHCYAVCMTVRCFGLGILHGIRYPFEDSERDEAAEEYGLTCANASRPCPNPPWWNPYKRLSISCVECCGDAIYDQLNFID